MEQARETSPSGQPFAFNFKAPFETFKGGLPQSIPYLVDGLLTQGGFSVLGAKPKAGKSSLSRQLAVSISKGISFLGRDTVKGEVLLLSLEDPLNHVDNCLSVLGYDPKTDARIRIVDKLAPTLTENIAALECAFTQFTNVRVAVIDTLAKFIRVQDLNDYMPVMTAVEQLHNLARKFPHVHILAVTHCKKVKSEDVFDGLLGSTALRGEPDTSVAIYGEGSQRVIATETRVGRNIPPTLLKAQVVESAGAHVVREFSLDVPLSDWKAEQTGKTERRRKLSYEERVIAYLTGRNNGFASQELLLEEVEGKRASLLEAIQQLKKAGVVEITGTSHSPADPLTLSLNRDSLRMNDFINRFNTEDR